MSNDEYFTVDTVSHYDQQRDSRTKLCALQGIPSTYIISKIHIYSTKTAPDLITDLIKFKLNHIFDHIAGLWISPYVMDRMCKGMVVCWRCHGSAVIVTTGSQFTLLRLFVWSIQLNVESGQSIKVCRAQINKQRHTHAHKHFWAVPVDSSHMSKTPKTRLRGLELFAKSVKVFRERLLAIRFTFQSQNRFLLSN